MGRKNKVMEKDIRKATEKLTKSNKKFIKEFKEFIARGNVVDLAVGVVIGGAFSKIVSSLVNDIIMPLVGIIIGGIDFTNLSIKFKDATINYGNFIQTVIDFLIVAWCIFIVIKLINSFQRKKKEEDKKEEPPKKDEQIIILEEIRDILKKNNK